MSSRSGTLRAPILATCAALAVLAGGCAGDSDAETETEQEEPEEEQELSAGEVLAEGEAPDGHPLREVPAEEAPTVALAAEPDDHGGWNVQVDTDGFEFSPEETGGDAHGGQGHAHLYIDGEKYARMYGPWFHLPAEALTEGEHSLMVTLNADDHSAWAVDGELVQAEQQVDADAAAEPHDHGDGEDMEDMEDDQDE